MLACPNISETILGLTFLDSSSNYHVRYRFSVNGFFRRLTVFEADSGLVAAR